MEHHPIRPYHEILICITVFSVANDGMARCRRMDTDLVHSACDQPRLKPSRVREALLHSKPRLAGFTVGVDPADPFAIREDDFLNGEVNSFFVIRPSAMNDEIIMFLEMVFGSKLLLKTSQKGSLFGNHQ